MIAAVNEQLYQHGNACGWKYNVRCIKHPNTNVCRGDSFVTVKIVDFCPTTNCSTAITLSREAFSKIADPEAQIVQVDLTR
ncbi:hypothetical protein ACSBR2_025393 [Camellia fascicularis]